MSQRMMITVTVPDEVTADALIHGIGELIRHQYHGDDHVDPNISVRHANDRLPPTRLNGYPVVAVLPVIHGNGLSARPGEWVVTVERAEPPYGTDYVTWHVFAPTTPRQDWYCQQGHYDLPLHKALRDMLDRAGAALLTGEEDRI
ncbi:MAG: hypothetical protein ACRDT6_18620 [Micromonosporaceae bacterium]